MSEWMKWKALYVWDSLMFSNFCLFFQATFRLVRHLASLRMGHHHHHHVQLCGEFLTLDDEHFWKYLATFGNIWQHLEIFGNIKKYLATFENI